MSSKLPTLGAAVAVVILTLATLWWQYLASESQRNGAMTLFLIALGVLLLGARARRQDEEVKS